jgi:putative tricarboxylic transport membrane protein
MIGLFALTELLVTADTVYKHYQVKQKITDISSSFRYWWENFYLSLRSSLMGTFLGALPGVGAVTASFVAYNDALQNSKSPEKMGKGQPEGIVAPESANNAVTGGAMIPLLSLGIPGDGVTAIMLGALLIHGLRPGPLLFKENIEVVYSIYLSMILAYLIILIIGIWGIKYLAKIVELPRYILFPFILFFSIIGSYALQNSMFDVYIALIFGILGYFMRRYDFPLGPFLLALVLGDLVEYNLIVSLQISKGNWLSFLTRPISGTLLVITFLFLVFRTIKIQKENSKNVK